jgi:hypothetical protein
VFTDLEGAAATPARHDALVRLRRVSLLDRFRRRLTDYRDNAASQDAARVVH